MQKILRRFPDYGKASPDYVIGLVEFVATFPDSVQDAFVDVSKGIATRTKFTPTVFDFQVMADELIGSFGEREAQAFRLNDLQARVEARRNLPEVKFIQPVQYFDKRNNRITERESREREALALREKESLRKTDRLTAYVRFLGGWEKAIEQGVGCVDDVPNEWRVVPSLGDSGWVA